MYGVLVSQGKTQEEEDTNKIHSDQLGPAAVTWTTSGDWINANAQ